LGSSLDPVQLGVPGTLSHELVGGATSTAFLLSWANSSCAGADFDGVASASSIAAASSHDASMNTFSSLVTAAAPAPAAPPQQPAEETTANWLWAALMTLYPHVQDLPLPVIFEGGAAALNDQLNLNLNGTAVLLGRHRPAAGAAVVLCDNDTALSDAATRVTEFSLMFNASMLQSIPAAISTLNSARLTFAAVRNPAFGPSPHIASLVTNVTYSPFPLTSPTASIGIFIAAQTQSLCVAAVLWFFLRFSPFHPPPSASSAVVRNDKQAQHTYHCD
jgi:hypothetical protein